MRCFEVLAKKSLKGEVLEVGNVYKGTQEISISVLVVGVGLMRKSPAARECATPTSGVGAIDQFWIQPIDSHKPR